MALRNDVSRSSSIIHKIIHQLSQPSHHTVCIEPARLRCLRLMTLSDQQQRHLARDTGVSTWMIAMAIQFRLTSGVR
jgi:hypothetical protein